MIATRQIFLGASRGNAEEEMYKELLTQILSNTLPTGSELDLMLPAVRQSAFAYLTTLRSITIHGVTALTANYLLQGSSVVEAIFPDVVTNTSFSFYQCASLKTIRMPNLKNSMQNMLVIGTSVLTDVYIENSSCSEIIAIPGFPGMNSSQNSNYPNVVFHGSDGTIAYNGSSWVITPNS